MRQSRTVESVPELDVGRLVRGWRKAGRGRQSRKLRLRGGIELRIAVDMRQHTLMVRADDGRLLCTAIHQGASCALAQCPGCSRPVRYIYLPDEGDFGCRDCAMDRPLRWASEVLHHDTTQVRRDLRSGNALPVVLRMGRGGEDALVVRRSLELEGLAQRWASLEPLVERRRRRGQYADRGGGEG